LSTKASLPRSCRVSFSFLNRVRSTTLCVAMPAWSSPARAARNMRLQPRRAKIAGDCVRTGEPLHAHQAPKRHHHQPFFYAEQQHPVAHRSPPDSQDTQVGGRESSDSRLTDLHSYGEGVAYVKSTRYIGRRQHLHMKNVLHREKRQGRSRRTTAPWRTACPALKA
jgi:hypothetical protein